MATNQKKMQQQKCKLIRTGGRPAERQRTRRPYPELVQSGEPNSRNGKRFRLLIPILLLLTSPLLYDGLRSTYAELKPSLLGGARPRVDTPVFDAIGRLLGEFMPASASASWSVIAPSFFTSPLTFVPLFVVIVAVGFLLLRRV